MPTCYDELENWSYVVDASHQKGKSLEMAVHAIESEILRRSPSYNEKTFRIEGNKIITTSGGVHHEIDVWVNVDIGGGQSETVILECKNRKMKVSKNDIIIFERGHSVTF